MFLFEIQNQTADTNPALLCVLISTDVPVRYEILLGRASFIYSLLCIQCDEQQINPITTKESTSAWTFHSFYTF